MRVCDGATERLSDTLDRVDLVFHEHQATYLLPIPTI
jgi:hypothetical protein